MNNKLNGNLQYRLSNGSWENCDSRTDEFLNKCVKNDYHGYTTEQAIDLLNAGKSIMNGTDWYAHCRIAPVATRPAPAIVEWEPDSESYGY